MARYGYDAARDDTTSDDSSGGSDDAGGGGVDPGDVLDGGGSSGSDPTVGGGSDDDGGSDSGGSPGGSSPPPSDVGGPSGGGSSGGGGGSDPAPSPGGSSPPPSDVGGPSGGGSSGGSDSGGSPGGSSPPPSDVGGPDGAAPDPAGPGGSSPPASDVGGPNGGATDPSSPPQPQGSNGQDPATDGRRSAMPAGPGMSDDQPSRFGALGDAARDRVGSAERDAEVVDQFTTGGVLSERGESAGLLPDEAFGVDISETRARETARELSAAGEALDAGAVSNAQARLVAPFTGGQGVQPSGRDVDPASDTGGETVVENAFEGAAQVPFDAPGGALQAETAAEVAQAVGEGQVGEQGTGDVTETGVAVGRDAAARTATQAQQNPGEFAGAVGAGLLLGGAGAASSGTAASGLRAGLRAEVDPRVGPFGTTAETRVARGVRDFLDDDRGQAQLLGRQRGRESDSDADTGVASDEDLGPDLDPFDRSDTRLRDPARQFDDDIGGMQDAPDPVDPADATSRQDIGGGIGGRGEAGVRGSDADSFSDRGFGEDFDGFDQRFDRRSDDTVDADGDATAPRVDPAEAAGASVGATLGAAADPDAGADLVDGLGFAGGFGGVGATPDTRTTPDVDIFTDFDFGQDLGTDTPQDTPTDIDTDTPTTDLTDPDLRDPPTRDPRDPPRFDPGDPARRDPDPPFDLDSEDDSDDEFTLFGTRSDDGLVDSGLLSGSDAAANLFR